MIRQIGIFRKQLTGEGGRLIPSDFPLSPNFAHLEEYYDSRSPQYPNGADVTTWLDLSGHSRDQGVSDPSTTLPKMLTGGSPKGTNLIRFTVAANSAMTSGTITDLPVATRGFTYYFYGNFSGSAGSAVLWATSLFGRVPQEISLVRSSKSGWRDNAGFHLPVSPNITGVHQIAYVFTPPSGTGTCQMYVDGVPTGLPTVWTIAGPQNDVTMLGNTINFNTPVGADMGHVVWYSDAHTAAQVALFKVWASIYWGF